MVRFEVGGARARAQNERGGPPDKQNLVHRHFNKKILEEEAGLRPAALPEAAESGKGINRQRTGKLTVQAARA